MESLWLDIKYGARMLRRNPGFTLVAILALALGIGSTTSIFTVVYGVLLHPLRYTEPERLVLIFEGIPGARSGPIGFSPPDFAFFEQQQTQSFDGVAAFSPAGELYSRAPCCPGRSHDRPPLRVTHHGDTQNRER